MASHVPVAIQWLQSQRIDGLPSLQPLGFPAQYPADAKMMVLWLGVPTHRDSLLQLASIPGVALLVLATAMGARELGAPGPAAWTAGVLPVIGPRTLTHLVGTNMEDMLSAGAVAATLAFVARDRTHRGNVNAAMVGLAAGLAIGTRFAAIAVIPPILLAMVIARRRGRSAPGLRMLRIIPSGAARTRA